MNSATQITQSGVVVNALLFGIVLFLCVYLINSSLIKDHLKFLNVVEHATNFHLQNARIVSRMRKHRCLDRVYKEGVDDARPICKKDQQLLIDNAEQENKSIFDPAAASGPATPQTMKQYLQWTARNIPKHLTAAVTAAAAARKVTNLGEAMEKAGEIGGDVADAAGEAATLVAGGTDAVAIGAAG
jgi:hypothetical protein